MSFEFRSLTLKNWLVYSEVKINFDAPDQKRNLIVFYGRNGFGKTSLLRALQFVFHGRLDHNELYNFLHDPQKNAGLSELAVTLEFLFDGQIHQLTRMATISPSGNAYNCSPSVKLIIDGHNQQDQIDDVIAKIIPKQTQQFVFFDGAEITRYSKRQHEDGVKEAIEQVLGIPAIRNLRDDLYTLIGKLEDEQADILSKQNIHTDLLQGKEEIEDLIASLETDKQTTSDRIKALRDALNKLQDEQIQVRLMEQDIRTLEEKEKRLADYEERLKEIESKIDEQIKSAPLRLLVNPIHNLLQQSEAKQRVSDKRALTQERKRIVEEILNDGNCICGRDIDDTATQVLENMLARIDVLVGQAGGKGDLAASEFTQLTRIHHDQQSKSAVATELISQKASINVKIDEVDADIRKLKESLKGHENASISDIYNQQADLENRLNMELKDQARIEMELDNAKRKSDDIQRKLDQSMTQTTQGDALKRTLLDTRNLHKAVSEYVEKLVKLKRIRIEEITTEIFLSITNKPDEYAGVTVEADYTLQVYRKDGSIVENEKLSSGEKEVLAYSFITALNLSTEIPAPFVMDTPFGHLDATHRNQLLDSLPRLGVQVLLLATDRDLPPVERDRIEPFILQEYEIIRDQKNARSIINPA